MSGIAGLRGTGNWGTDERPKNFREGILWYNPAGSAPIFALTSKAGKKTVDDPEFAWWAESQTIVRLQVAGALSSSDTTVVVDSGDPGTTTMSANYGTATHLKPGDLLLVEPATDNATYNNEMLEVTDVVSDTQFTVRRGAAGTSAATIANDLWLLRIGSVYAEGTSAPRPTSRNPVKFYNYTQIFKDTYELTGTADETKTRTGSAWSNDKKRKTWDHSSNIEHSILFGQRSESTGDNGKPKRTMGGLRSFIPSANTTVFTTPVTPSSLLTALEPSFDFDTGAGDTRIGFTGNRALIELSKVFAGEVIFNVNDTVQVYGMNFTKFVMPFGTLLLKSHPLLSRNTLYRSSMFVCDFDAIKYVAMKNRDTKPHDDVQAKDEDVRRGYFQTEASIQVDYGGLSMAYIGGISST
jgi:hypothetical protein